MPDEYEYDDDDDVYSSPPLPFPVPSPVGDVVGDLAGDTSGEAPRSTPLPVLFVLLLLLLVVALAGLEPPEALPAAEGVRGRAMTSRSSISASNVRTSGG